MLAPIEAKALVLISGLCPEGNVGIEPELPRYRTIYHRETAFWTIAIGAIGWRVSTKRELNWIARAGRTMTSSRKIHRADDLADLLFPARKLEGSIYRIKTGALWGLAPCQSRAPTHFIQQSEVLVPRRQ